jgi:hypothetical protein
MARSGARRTARRLVAAGLLVVCALQMPAVTFAASVHDVLPDLRMALPGHVQLCPPGETSPGHPICSYNQTGHRELRFDSIIENLGEGPLEVHGKRACADCSRMTTKQWIKRSDGTWRVRKTDALQRYTNADFHHHWHVMGMERYEVFPMDAPFPNGEVIGHKYGFCFFDGMSAPDPSASPVGPYHYSFYGCGTTSSQSTLVGLTVGRGDIYPYNYPGQFIDIQDVPAGDYLVCLTADKARDFDETREGNNQSWAKITLTEPAEGETTWGLTVGESGQRNCRTQLPWMGPATRSAAGAAEAAAGPRLAEDAPPSTARAAALRFTCSMSGLGTARA